MGYFNSQHNYHKPLQVNHGDNATVIVVVFFAVAILVGIGSFFFLADILPVFAIIFLSFAAGIAAAVVVAKTHTREKAEYISQSDEDMRANNEAETQKQIDAMLQNNSKIPKVKT